MDRKYKEEVQIAFNIWELLGQLDALIRDRYFEDFTKIIYNLEKDVDTQLDDVSNPSE
ncbi:MAG: hypothetical protein KKD44_00210 [Proteobacteria bacterium]|nr:hypothetical protein [Pseudomonadota bacterium]